MCSTGEEGTIHRPDDSHKPLVEQRIKNGNRFMFPGVDCVTRGAIKVKGKGEMKVSVPNETK
jgi:hypothetical protein